MKTIGGITFDDPFAWLQDDSREALDWQWAQDAAAQQYLAGLPGMTALLESARRMYQDPHRALLGGQYVRRGGRWFALAPSPDGGAAIWVSESPHGGWRTVIDSGRMARELGTDLAVAVNWFQPSPDSRYVGFTVASGGEMGQAWRVAETDTGRFLPLSISMPYCDRPLLGWHPESRGFFLFDRAPDNRHRVRFFDPESGQRPGSEQVFDTAWIPEAISEVVAQVSPRGSWLLGMSTPHEHVALVLGDLRSGTWRRFLPEGFIGECHGHWLDDDTYLAIVTDETPRGRVAAIPAATSQDRSTWRTLVPESEAVPRAVTIVGDRIVLCEITDVSVRLRLFRLDGTADGEAPLEPYGSSSVASVLRRFEDSEALTFPHNTFTRANTDYHLDVARGELTVIGTPGERIEGLTVARRFAISRDGTRVPYFVVHGDAVDISHPQPALIYGYGGFNIALLPSFLGPMAPFLHAGGVFIHANLWGGAEYGREWYESGRLHNKQNTFDDLFAVAEDAIAAGIASPERLAFKGESNGGLLAGVAIVQRPDLWRAVVPGIPLFDMMEPLRADDPNVGAVRAIFQEDYGDPTNPEDAPISYAYSPYHNVRDGVEYPAVLQVFGEKDIGCKPYHGRKFTARLQAATTSGQPVLLRVWKNTGHGSMEPEVAARQQADVLGFLMHHLGIGIK
jgi:prolyl oligopeptidase